MTCTGKRTLVLWMNSECELPAELISLPVIPVDDDTVDDEGGGGGGGDAWWWLDLVHWLAPPSPAATGHQTKPSWASVVTSATGAPFF